MFSREEFYLTQPDHVSPGEMIPQSQSFQTIQQYFGDIAVAAIEDFDGIPDFIGETINPYPTVLNTSGRYICLDGSHILAEARRERKEKILCLIEVADNCPNEEIALRKVATRMLPSNGKCTYLETIRNTKELYKMLMDTRENLICFHHGGRRRGNEFINNREENVRLILATRLGKSPKTISKYLNHGEYLNDDAISALMAMIPDQTVIPNKEFFEMAQSNKNKIKVDLKSEKVTENEISEQLSTYVLQMFDEYKRTGGIRNYRSVQDVASEDNGDQKPPDDNAEHNGIADRFLPKPFHYYTGNELSHEQASFDVDDLKTDIALIGEKLLNLSRNQNAQCPEIVLCITACISTLSECLQKCRAIEPAAQNNMGGKTLWVN
ncbi:MAG TPA: hypothetical protein PLQ69_07840 [Paludibacter sp.]|nr:hypothetical protein [Paludibacter sp.]